MLPFLKNKQEGGMSGTVDEVKKRMPDNEDQEDYGMLDAIAEDIMDAVQKKDKKVLKGALEALIEHIQEADEIQDEELTEGYDRDDY